MICKKCKLNSEMRMANYCNHLLPHLGIIGLKVASKSMLAATAQRHYVNNTASKIHQ
jgi:hypothetical protein